MEEKLNFAGEIQVQKIEVITSRGFTLDISNLVLSIQVFEDMFTPFISGSIVIEDSLDLTNLFPLVGEEFINITLKTPTLDKKDAISGQFFIHKMSDRELLGDKTAIYRLQFISVEAIVDLNKSISRAFKGKISDIVKELLGKTGLESKKQLNVEETQNGFKYVSNFWSPLKNIIYCTGNSLNHAKSPSYIFFENRYGLNYVTLDSLYKNPVKQSFIYDEYTRDLVEGGSVRNVGAQFQRLLDKPSAPVMFDYIDRVQSGLYASKMISYDTITKKYRVKNYSYSRKSSLNPFPMVSKSAIVKAGSKINLDTRHYGVHNGYTSISNTETLQERDSLLAQFGSQKIEILVRGRTDYTVGQKINLTLWKTQPNTKEESIKKLMDEVLSGNYLISAICHHVDRESHQCSIELMKESYILNLDK